MWSIGHGHSDIMYVVSIVHSLDLSKLHNSCHELRNSFWIIALPLMVVVVPLFLMSDLKRMLHFIQKKVIAKNVKKVCTNLVCLFRQEEI